MQNEIVAKLKAEEMFLRRIIEKAQARISKAPEGTLRTAVKEGTLLYYQGTRERDTSKEIRTYIPKDNTELVKQLAQKRYDQKILKAAVRQSDAIGRFLKAYAQEDPKEIFRKLSSDQKALIETDIPDDETYVKRWLAVKYSPGPFSSDSPEYYTLKGERVRSKTEKIIADTLFMAGIPYRYECPVQLRNGQVWRPDFMILNVRMRKEFILEHLGMMDDPEYLSNALGKISGYIQNDIFPGDQLIITFESKTRPFSTKDLAKLIDHYFR